MTQTTLFEIEPAVDPFANWVYRQDINGRCGWEHPRVPAWMAWWRRCDFEDLPQRLTPIGRHRRPGSLDGP